MKKKLSLLLVLILAISLPLSLHASANETFALTLTLPEGRTADDLWLIYDEEVYPDLNALSGAFVFELGLHEKFDPVYTTIYKDGIALQAQPDGKYAIFIDNDVEITCPLNNGTNFRLKMFDVSNPSGDGFRIRPEASVGFQNYKVNWDDTYYFRVILLDDYKGAYIEDDYENSRLNVSVSYFITVDGEQEEVFLQVGDEGLEFVGTDTDGSPLFKITNIRHDMHVNVGLLTSDSFSSVISWMQRIVRLLINLFTGGGDGGVDIDSFFQRITDLFNGAGGGLGGLGDL